MAQRLYPGAIETEGGTATADSSAVIFEPFGGISPNRFDNLFAMPSRKDRLGYAVRWEPNRQRYPEIRFGRQAYLEIETAICNYFEEKLNRRPVV